VKLRMEMNYEYDLILLKSYILTLYSQSDKCTIVHVYNVQFSLFINFGQRTYTDVKSSCKQLYQLM
jgi:hypothetical protein